MKKIFFFLLVFFLLAAAACQKTTTQTSPDTDQVQKPTENKQLNDLKNSTNVKAILHSSNTVSEK